MLKPKSSIFWDETPCRPLMAKQDLISCLSYSSTLKMEETYSSETSVVFQRTTRRYIPEDRTPHNDRCENLRPYTILKPVVRAMTC
jgi:hypothetical protein